MADGVIVSLLVSLIVVGFAERRNAWRSQRRYSHLRSRLKGTLALYELRTYTLCVGKMPEAVKLYQELGFPALQWGGHEKKLIGYFQGDTGMDRRAHWAAAFANTD